MTGELTEVERAEVDQIIRWHVGCHVESPDGGYLGLCVENVLLRIESILAARAQVDAGLIRAAEVRGARQALLDAAGALDLPGSDASGYYASECHSGYREAERHIEAWLLDRADNLPDPEEG